MAGFRTTSTPDFTGKLDQMIAAAQEAMEEAVTEAARFIEEAIRTRGTPKSGKQGRIETGLMYESVDNEVEVNGALIKGKLGWRNFQLYFQLQEEGFIHLGGEQVPGMMAFEDAKPFVRQEVVRRLAEKLERIF